MFRCTVHLYYPPAWELAEDGVADPASIRALGDRLRAQCRAAAGAVEALAERGWRCRYAHYGATATKDCDRAEAMLDLLRADLDPVRLGLEELSDEPG